MSLPFAFTTAAARVFILSAARWIMSDGMLIAVRRSLALNFAALSRRAVFTVSAAGVRRTPPWKIKARGRREPLNPRFPYYEVDAPA